MDQNRFSKSSYQQFFSVGRFIVDITLAIVLFVPYLLVAFIKLFYFTRKDVSGQLVLVTFATFQSSFYLECFY